MVLALILAVFYVLPAFANQDAIRDSVVRLYAIGHFKSEIGSAFAVGKSGKSVRYFVTNKHCLYCETDVKGEREPAIRLSIIIGNSTADIPCNVVAISDRCDLAIVDIEGYTDERKPAILRTFDPDVLGEHTEEVWTYGYPGVVIDLKGGTGDFLLSDSKTLNVTRGTTGMVSPNGATAGEQIFHDANISGGNSGGPLVDKNGYILGVNTWGIHDSYENNNAALFGAISSNEVARFLDEEKIPYTTVKDIRNRRILMIAMIIAVLAAFAAMILLVLNRKPQKGKKISGSGTGKGGSRTLVCDAGELAGKQYPLSRKMMIGRSSQSCDIVFSGSAKGVSAKHCTITFENGTVMVTDEKSTYGTWIDEVKLEPGVPKVMHRGQKLYIGSKQQAFSLHS